MFLIHVQGQRRHRAPPLARRADFRFKRTGADPIDTEQIDSGAIGRQNQYEPIRSGANGAAGVRDESLGRRAPKAALDGVSGQFLFRQVRPGERHEKHPITF